MNSTIEADLKKIASDVVKEVASMTSRGLMTAGTYPISQSFKTAKGTTSNKNMMSKKGVGEFGKQVQKDLNRTFISKSSAAFSPHMPSDKASIIRGMYGEAKRKSNKAASLERRVNKIIRNVGSLHSWDESDHEKNRIEGKIPKSYKANAYLDKPQAFKRHRQKKLNDVGKAKSGWIGPPNSWYSRVPKWLKRTGLGSFHSSGLVTIIANKVPYVSKTMVPSAVDTSFDSALEIVAKNAKYSKLLKKI